MDTDVGFVHRTTPILRIAGRKLGVVDSATHLIRPAEVLYFFSGSAARFIVMGSFGAKLFSPGCVYARTAEGVYKLRARSIAELSEALSGWNCFVVIHQSILVNILKAVRYTRGKTKLVEVKLGERGSELLPISRRYFAEFSRRVWLRGTRRQRLNSTQ